MNNLRVSGSHYPLISLGKERKGINERGDQYDLTSN